MRTAIEISLYPLDADYLPSIKSFIERLHQYPELQVLTNAMSTQVAGPGGHPKSPSCGHLKIPHP